MKIRPFIIATLILALVAISALVIGSWNTHIILLKSGEIIEADKTWVVFDEVYYEKGEGTLFTVKTSAVDEIAHAGFTGVNDWKIILSHAMDSRQGVFKILMSQKTWVVCVSFLGIYLLMGLFRFIASKRAYRKEDDADDEYIPIHISPASSDSEKIVLFFLNIFLLELKIKHSDRYHYRRMDIKGPLNTTVYEFRANIDGQWQTRRMSMGRIGEDSGARSKCFYVIYDEHFVVKLPPEPLTDIHAYIKSIQSDRQIAETLAPRECLVPRVSVVLNRIPSFVNSIGRTPLNIEQKCLDGLTQHPEFQKFLTIGETFAFFTDLSKHFFLGQVLKDCHNADSEILREIHNHKEIIWTPDAFAHRYGQKYLDLCFALQDAYAEFDRQYSDPSVPVFQKQSWFAGAFLGEPEGGSPAKISADALTIINALKIKNQAVLREYRDLIKNYTREIFFRQNISKIGNICTRLVELLAWLFFKNIAIRDLKPDNLLVAGDTSRYPHFLNSADDFVIGLIDVEIAVYVDPENKKTAQPKLGWTPFYATPSHMFVNKVLDQLYDDTGEIYFLQDWYAAVAMIYQAVTAEKLFVKTAATLASFSGELHKYYGKPSEMARYAKKANIEFWRSASWEFEQKMLEKALILTAIHLDITRNAKKMFRKAAGKSRQETIATQLLAIKSGISVYDLLECLFAHVKDVMGGNVSGRD